MRTFKIYKDFVDAGCNIHSKSRIELQPGVTVLVGCNGYGKTTLIKQLKQILEKDKTPVISYNNLHDGGSHSRSEAMFLGDYQFAATSMCSSEGENINMNLARFASKIAAFVKSNKQAKELFILLDAVDSGLSVDNIIDLKDLFDIIVESNADKDVYIVIAANEYELVRGSNCFDVYKCQYRQFKTYEAYRNFIIRTRKVKDARKYK